MRVSVVRNVFVLLVLELVSIKGNRLMSRICPHLLSLNMLYDRKLNPIRISCFTTVTVHRGYVCAPTLQIGKNLVILIRKSMVTKSPTTHRQPNGRLGYFGYQVIESTSPCLPISHYSEVEL